MTPLPAAATLVRAASPQPTSTAARADPSARSDGGTSTDIAVGDFASALVGAIDGSHPDAGGKAEARPNPVCRDDHAATEDAKQPQAVAPADLNLLLQGWAVAPVAAAPAAATTSAGATPTAAATAIEARATAHDPAERNNIALARDLATVMTPLAHGVAPTAIAVQGRRVDTRAATATDDAAATSSGPIERQPSTARVAAASAAAVTAPIAPAADRATAPTGASAAAAVAEPADTPAPAPAPAPQPAAVALSGNPHLPLSLEHGTAADRVGEAPMPPSLPASGPAPAPHMQPTQAPAAPILEQHLATALGSPAFAPALASQVKWLVREGVPEARLTLNPAEMGPLSVRITLDGTQARVDFSANHASTRNAIEASLPVLAAALHDSGITLSGGGVFDGQPRQQMPQSRPGETTTVPSAGATAASPSAAASVVTQPRAARGLVDLVA